MAKVKDLMTKDVITVPAACTLSDAARTMRDQDIGILPVVEGTRLLGVVTDRDIVVRGLAEGRTNASVAEVMQANVVCVSPDDDEKDAEQTMSEHEVRRLPVVDKSGALVGMLSVGDLAARNADRAGKVMQETGPGH